jgi:hypothetical protein
MSEHEQQIIALKDRLWQAVEDVDAAVDRYLDHHAPLAEIERHAKIAATIAHRIAEIATPASAAREE